MDAEKRLSLIKEVGEEIVTEDELRQLLSEKKSPTAYDGFEPSGKIHIAQGLLRAININKMTKAGCKFKMLVADWHGWANNKMNGDLDKIQTVGKYFIETWKACDMDLDNVEFVWVSDYVKDPEYWKIVMQVARNTTLQRIVRTGQIMGRKDSEVQQASQILYPCMQAADIFHLKADICQLGMDQRKVNMLAREIGPKLGFWKPVIVSHHMLLGLQHKLGEGDAFEKALEMKMSKSKPESAIFMTDSEEEIKKKLSKAFCPEKQITENPVIEYYRHIVFQKFDKIKIERPEKFGGDVEFSSFDELANDYASGKMHPMDLKNAAAIYVDKLVKPVRDHFEKNSKAKELAETVASFETTR
jgi:tyrosyl-tRNA synthetase